MSTAPITKLALLTSEGKILSTHDNPEQAMRAYSLAGFIGSIKPLSECLNDGLVHTGAAAQVSQIAVERISRHERQLADLGIALPPPVYAAGTRVVSLGFDNFRTSRDKLSNTPLTVQSLPGVVQAVQAENREDITVTARDLHMTDDGMLWVGDVMEGNGIEVEERGMLRLCSLLNDVFPRAGRYMVTVDPELRAYNFNRQIGKLDRERKLRLRTRKSPTGRSMFAAVSSKYAAYDADKVATSLIAGLEGSGMRGEVVYNPETTSLRVDGLYHADNVVDLAAGDVFKVGVRFRSHDAAGGSISAEAMAWRNLCLNLIIIGTGSANLMRQRHSGKVRDIRAAVDQAGHKAKHAFKKFADEWGVLRRCNAFDVLELPRKVEGETGDDGVKRVFEALADIKAYRDSALSNAVAVESLMSGWNAEPGTTLADILNAMTRTAHTDARFGNAAREKAEVAAGRLVPILAKRARRRTPLMARPLDGGPPVMVRR